MNINFLLEYVNLITLGICLCIGFVIKQSLTFVPNKYIPLIMLCIGTVINIACNLTDINAAVILGGMISGLASTGMYEAMRNLINKDGKNEG
ncbi:MAG: phage holin family protein [Velocimicrobium sp.]